MDMEQNAIGRFLLKQGLDVFVEAKAVGTFLSIALCYYISKTKYKMAIPAVCFFQLALFFYLSFDTIFTGWRLPNQFSDYPVQAFISMQMNR